MILFRCLMSLKARAAPILGKQVGIIRDSAAYRSECDVTHLASPALRRAFRQARPGVSRQRGRPGIMPGKSHSPAGRTRRH